MQIKKKADRSHQQTARMLKQFRKPFDAPAFEHSQLMFAGFAASLPGLPGYLVARGRMETKCTHLGDRPIVFDARTVIGTQRLIRDVHRLERCLVTLRNRSGKTVCIDFNASREAIEAAILKARA